MASGFAFDAPQYYDFENGDLEDQQNAERYFGECSDFFGTCEKCSYYPRFLFLERNHESPGDGLNPSGSKSVGATPVMFHSIIDNEGRLTDYYSPFDTESPGNLSGINLKA